MKWYSSIKVQISIFIVVLITVILTAFGFFDYFTTKKKMIRELDHFSDVTITRLSKHLVLSLWDLNKKQAEESIVAEMMEKRIYAIILLDRDGETVFLGKKRDERWIAVDSDQSIIGDFIKKQKDLVLNNSKLGTVIVYMTSKFMEQEFRKYTLKIIVQVIVLDLIIFLAIFLLISNRIIIPLKQLTTAAEKISMGELKTRIDIKLDNEIGLLAQAIDRMKISLSIALNQMKTTK